LLGVIFLYPALGLWFGRTSNAFRELHTARNWRRWEEVLRCLEKLRNAQRATKIGIGEAEMVRYQALALAGLGKLDEANELFREPPTKANMPQWLYLSFQASLYTVAKQYDKGLECYRSALEIEGSKHTVCIDLANYLVQRFNQPAEARQLLARAEQAQLSELA